jgi:hypothetical protein
MLDIGPIVIFLSVNFPLNPLWNACRIVCNPTRILLIFWACTRKWNFVLANAWCCILARVGECGNHVKWEIVQLHLIQELVRENHTSLLMMLWWSPSCWNQWTHRLPSSLFISWLDKVRYCIAHYNVIRCEGETWYSKPMKSTCLNEELH